MMQERVVFSKNTSPTTTHGTEPAIGCYVATYLPMYIILRVAIYYFTIQMRRIS